MHCELPPPPAKSLASLDAELNADRKRAEVAWASRHCELPTPSKSLPEVNAQLDAERKKAEAAWTSMHCQLTQPEKTLSQLQAELRADRKRAEVAWASAQQELTWVLEASPSAIAHSQPTFLDTFANLLPGECFKVLSWDDWYNRVARISQTPLVKALSNHGNPAGYTKLRITVWPDNHLVAELLSSGNPDFDSTVLEAYAFLDGNPALAFPIGSHRPVVRFLTDNWHDSPGLATGVYTQAITGDREYQLFRP